jgi:hypothetical protein
MLMGVSSSLFLYEVATNAGEPFSQVESYCKCIQIAVILIFIVSNNSKKFHICYNIH